jgi:tetratricopeptide (TPR) repeat protein
LDPDYGYAHYGMGKAAATRGDYTEAEKRFRKALSLTPEWPNAELELARSLLNLGKSEEAVLVLEKHVQRQPFLSEAYFLLGQAYSQQKEHQKAKESYAAAIRLGARTTEAHYGLATVCARVGEKDLARQHMEKFQELRAEEFELRKRQKVGYDDLEAMKVDTAVICANAAQFYLTQKRPAEAEKLWRRAAAFDPLHVESRQGLAWVCRRSGRVPEAVRWLQQLAEIDPENAAYPLEIGRLQTELQQFDAAEVAFQTVRQRFPEEAAGYAALAQLYLATEQDLNEARRLAEKAVELAPTAVNYVVLAAICEKQNDLLAALAAMERAKTLAPENPGHQKAYEWLKKKQESK